MFKYNWKNYEYRIIRIDRVRVEINPNQVYHSEFLIEYRYKYFGSIWGRWKKARRTIIQSRNIVEYLRDVKKTLQWSREIEAHNAWNKAMKNYKSSFITSTRNVIK